MPIYNKAQLMPSYSKAQLKKLIELIEREFSLNEYRGYRMKVQNANDDINVQALVKGKERYILFYDDAQRAEALRALGRHASNSELSFTWYDAAVMSHEIRSHFNCTRRK